MELSLLILLLAGGFIAGVLLAALITWWLWGRKLPIMTMRALQAEAQLKALEDTEQHMRDTFASLSQTALQASNAQFLQLAQERLERQQQAARNDLSALVDPLKTTLEQQHEHLRTLEQARHESYSRLDTLIVSLKEDQLRLQSETANLVTALRQPQVRGRWGELQLRKVVELAGMSDHCDFDEQQTNVDDEGRTQRPDMLVRLPNQRQIVIDAKVPLAAYLEALEAADDSSRKEKLVAHARQVRTHVTDMSRRAYQSQIDGAHDFVVLFIPGEVFYSAALQHDRELLDYAFSKNVILATPSTLIALLKAVAQGWNEVRLAEDARKVKEVGEQLYKNLSTLADHISKIGKGLGDAVKAYNSTIGSMESRLLPCARRLSELQVSSDTLTVPQEIDDSPRTFVKPELTQM